MYNIYGLIYTLIDILCINYGTIVLLILLIAMINIQPLKMVNSQHPLADLMFAFLSTFTQWTLLCWGEELLALISTSISMAHCNSSDCFSINSCSLFLFSSSHILWSLVHGCCQRWPFAYHAFNDHIITLWTTNFMHSTHKKHDN